MSNYTMNTVLPGGQIPTLDLGRYSGERRLPNKKISIGIHEAHGGYIVEISTHTDQLADLYIVGEDQDLGQELGKIITTKVLKENHE